MPRNLVQSTHDPVSVEEARSSYTQLPLTLSVSVLNSVLLGFVLTPVASGSRILIWISLIVGLSAFRYGTVVRAKSPGRCCLGQPIVDSAGSFRGSCLWDSVGQCHLPIFSTRRVPSAIRCPGGQRHVRGCRHCPRCIFPFGCCIHPACNCAARCDLLHTRQPATHHSRNHVLHFWCIVVPC